MLPHLAAEKLHNFFGVFLQFQFGVDSASGNSVSLYARMEGVSNRQAFRALTEEGGLYRFPEQPMSKKPPEREPASLARRHDTYYDMLSHLELSPKHRADLLARGFFRRAHRSEHVPHAARRE